MKKAKKLLSVLLYPPAAVLAAVPAISFAALFFVFIADIGESAAAYAVYVMSAYSLAVVIAAAVRYGGRTADAVKKSVLFRRISSCGAVKRYTGDIAFRGSVGIYSGMAVNFLYVIFRLITGIMYSSVWFVSMAVYHFVLGAVRAVLVYGHRHSDGGRKYELRYYRASAYMLFLLNIPMGGMILLMVMTDTGTAYPQYIMYLSALFTFYTMILSAVNLVRYRKVGSPILSAAKVMNFVSAMMSVLGLQTSMIACFSENDEQYRRLMNSITGGFIWVSVIITAVIMIVKAGKEASENEQIGK